MVVYTEEARMYRGSLFVSVMGGTIDHLAFFVGIAVEQDGDK